MERLSAMVDAKRETRAERYLEVFKDFPQCQYFSVNTGGARGAINLAQHAW